MKIYQKLLLYVLIAVVAAAVLSPWVFAAWNSFASSRREPAFEQIFGGVFIAAGVLFLVATPSLLRPRILRDGGIVSSGRRNVFYGFLLAVASMALLGVVMVLTGAITPGVSDPLYSIVRQSGKALVTALMVGFLEELFFRGMLFRGLMENSRPAVAFVVANLFYAVSHFFKPPEEFLVAGIDPLAGFRFLALCLAPFLDPAAILPGVIGLFLIGVVLSYALVRTGSLYLSIGLHAGWVFAIKTLSLYGYFTRADLGWVFGAKPKLVSGAATWVGILLVGCFVHVMTRRRLS
jgi:CAAX protease family protein